NTVPSFTAHASDGNTYVKIPQLQFLVNNKRQSILAQDLTYYSKSTLFDCVREWRDGGKPCNSSFKENGGGYAPSLMASTNSLDINVTKIVGVLNKIKKIFNPIIIDSHSYGFEWKDNNVTSDGEFPQYFIKGNAQYTPVNASKVPEKLRQNKF